MSALDFDIQGAKDAGYSDDDIRRYITESMKQEMVHDMSGADKFLAGAGSALTDIGLGGMQLLSHIIPGMDTQRLKEEADYKKELDRPLLQTGAGTAGKIAGDVAAFLPAALAAPATIPAGVGLGALSGALTPTGEQESGLQEVAKQALFGGAGSAVARGIGRVLSPKTIPEIKALMEEGIYPTAGEHLGKAAARVERGLTNFPLVGDIIRGGRTGAIEEFNTALAKDILRPLGVELPKGMKPGREMVEFIQDAVENSQNTLAKELSSRKLKMNPGLFSKVQSIRDELGQSVSPSKLDQFDNILQNEFLGRFTPTAGSKAKKPRLSMKGEVISEVEDDLRNMVRNAMGGDQETQQLGQALQRVLDSMSEGVLKQNPKILNKSVVMDKVRDRLDLFERASAETAGGVFSPGRYGRITRKKAGQEAAAAGGAVNQRFTETAGKVLGDLPSGRESPFSIAAVGAGLGMGGIPMALMGGTLLPLLYSNTGRKLFAKLMVERPEFLRGMGNLIGDTSSPAALAAIEGVK